MKQYQTVVLGSGYFSFGYAATHEDVLIVEATQLADPHCYGTLDGFAWNGKVPDSKGARGLYDALVGDGVVSDGRISVNELESAFCRFLATDMSALLLGTFCTCVNKTEDGYDLTLCNNEGLSHVFAKNVIDTRVGLGNRLGVLVYLAAGKEPCIPSVDGVTVTVGPAFYDDHRLITLAFEGEVDENRAKQRSLSVIEDSLRASGSKILQMSYCLFGAPVLSPYRDDSGIVHVDQRAFGNLFEMYEKGETWNDEAFDA